MSPGKASNGQKVRVSARVLKYHEGKDPQHDEPDEVVELTPREYTVSKEENKWD